MHLLTTRTLISELVPQTQHPNSQVSFAKTCLWAFMRCPLFISDRNNIAMWCCDVFDYIVPRFSPASPIQDHPIASSSILMNTSTFALVTVHTNCFEVKATFSDSSFITQKSKRNFGISYMLARPVLEFSIQACANWNSSTLSRSTQGSRWNIKQRSKWNMMEEFAQGLDNHW